MEKEYEIVFIVDEHQIKRRIRGFTVLDIMYKLKENPFIVECSELSIKKI